MSEPMVPLNIAVLTVSDTRTEETDRSGQALVERLTSAGHTLAEKRIVPDDVYRIRAVVANWIADSDVQVVITTGGTGWDGILAEQLDSCHKPCNFANLVIPGRGQHG